MVCSKRMLMMSVVVGGFIAIATNPALAFSTSTCLDEKIRWSGDSATLRTNSTSFPAGVWHDALQQAVDRININPSRFRYGLTADSGGVSRDNGENEVWGSTDSSVLQGAPAIAYTWWTCYWFFGNHVHLDEVDIIFDYGSPWQWASSESKAGLWNYGGSLRPMQTTATHELGHGLMLNHVNTEYNVMGTDFEHLNANGSVARAYMGEDSSDGAVFLYGLNSPLREDLGVVHWKYFGASGEYSDHTKTVMYNSSGLVLSNFDDGGETRYRVAKGQTVRAEFTYENNGASTQSSRAAGFFISTNNIISTSDRRIGGTTFTLSPDGVLTTTTTLTIPSDLISGQNYWLGVVIDETGSVVEIAEWNNASYLPIRVN